VNGTFIHSHTSVADMRHPAMKSMHMLHSHRKTIAGGARILQPYGATHCTAAERAAAVRCCGCLCGPLSIRHTASYSLVRAYTPPPTIAGRLCAPVATRNRERRSQHPPAPSATSSSSTGARQPSNDPSGQAAAASGQAHQPIRAAAAQDPCACALAGADAANGADRCCVPAAIAPRTPPDASALP
jgi:hypothetical protein